MAKCVAYIYELLFASAVSGPAQPLYVYGTVFINLFNDPVRTSVACANICGSILYSIMYGDAILVDDVMISPYWVYRHGIGCPALSVYINCNFHFQCAFMWTSSRIIVTIPSKTKFG